MLVVYDKQGPPRRCQKMEQNGNFLSLWDLVKFKYGTYIYHRIASVMRINNIPYVGGLRQTGPPPRRCQKMERHRKSSKSSAPPPPHALRLTERECLARLAVQAGIYLTSSCFRNITDCVHRRSSCFARIEKSYVRQAALEKKLC